MAKIILPAEFNQLVEFGTIESVEDENTGINYAEFKSLFTLHAKTVRRSLYQTYQAEQAGLSDTKNIVIRHNAKVIDTLKCKMAGSVYDIVMVDSDDGFGFNRYDSLTLRKNKKIGA
ncbi:phage head closure protein [Streptococcus ferus]|uniref:phage head closure protein n=1 Tax=Streptococcus ferus TaxID=1345 RepID=UPI003513E62E